MRLTHGGRTLGRGRAGTAPLESRPSLIPGTMLRLKTFGALAILRNGELAEDVRIQRRHLALLVVLAADGGGVTRDRLLALFWPDREPEKARHSLDEALSRPRRAIGREVILEGQASLVLNRALLGSDIADFREAMDRGDYEAAVAAYTGPFLDAVYVDGAPDFEQWTHARRTAFAKEYESALFKLMQAAIAAGDYPRAVMLAKRAADGNPLSGLVTVALMMALCYAGDQTAALDAYRVHATLVREELDAEPNPDVIAYAEEVRAGRVRPPANAAAGAPPPPAPRSAPAAERPTDPGPSVAVLPFVSISTEAGDDYFSDGMTEAIINALARVPGLRVCARTTTSQFKNKAVDVVEVGRRLGVRAVVEGTVIRDHDKVRVSAKLIAVEDGSQTWLGQYERALDNVFAIHDEIAQRIAQTLRVTVMGKGPAPRPSVVTAAYERFLHGRHFRSKRSPDGLRRAIKFYREAVAIAPEYAEAYAAEADTYAAALAYGAVPPQEAMQRIRAVAARAIAIDPNLAEPYAALGAVAALCDWDWEGAERLFERSLALDPQYQTAHMWRANYCYVPLGRLDEGLAALQRARRLDFVSPVLNCSIGMTQFFARRFDDAAEQFRSALELDPGFLYANYFLGRTEIQREHFAAAIDALERTVVLSDGAGVARSALGYAHARAGDAEEALAIAARLERPSATEYVSAFEPAFVHLGLGNDDAAIAGFERACEERSPFAIWLGVQPEAAHLRGNARFDAVLRRMGLERT